MTEREKMIAVIKQAFEEEGRMLKEQAKRVFSGEIKKASQGLPPLDEFIADALIAANIGDVTAWKARAEKAEKEVATLNERAKRFKIVVPMGTTVNSFGSELYRTQPNPYSVKQLYSDEEVEDIARQRDEYKHRAEVAEKECNEWKERAERMHKEALKQKQRVSDSKHSEDTMRNQLECAMSMVSEMEYAKRTLEILYMSGAITEEALRDAVKQAKLEIEEEDADDR